MCEKQNRAMNSIGEDTINRTVGADPRQLFPFFCAGVPFTSASGAVEDGGGMQGVKAFPAFWVRIGVFLYGGRYRYKCEPDFSLVLRVLPSSQKSLPRT